MKYTTRIATLLAAAAAVLAGVLPASAASSNISAQTACMKATATHKAYQCPAMLTGPAHWQMGQHPASLYTGNGHAPFLTGLYWTVDQHSSARAHGILHTYKTACLKGSNPGGCKQYKIRATMVLGSVRWHQVDPLDGGWYWSAMSWQYAGKGFSAPRAWHVSRGLWRP